MESAIESTNELQGYLKRWKIDYNYEKTTDIVEKLEELCRNGANLNHLEQERGFALIPNVFWNTKLIQFFTDRGCDINSRDENGDTALHLAIRRHSKYCKANTVIEFLLYELNADPKVTNLRGKTPLFTLAESSNFFGNLSNVARMLVERGGDVATRDKDGLSALHVHYNSMFFVDALCAEVDNLRTASWMYSETPLIMAARKGRLDLCKFLIEKGAFVNARDLQGYTALHYAVLNPDINRNLERLLIEHGADAKLKSISGMDPYDMNIFKMNDYTWHPLDATPLEMIEYLEMNGAKGILMRSDPYHINCMWMCAQFLCKEHDLQPSQEFTTNYDLIKEFIRQYELPVYDDSKCKQDEIYLAAMNTVARLSEGINSKFWNLLGTVASENKSTSHYFRILKFLSEELNFKSVHEDNIASIEEKDFKSLLEIVTFFESWFKKLIKTSSGSTIKNEATPERISHVHSIARLAIACFEKLITHVTKCNKVSGTRKKLYVKLCLVLTSLHSTRFADYDVMSANALSNNKRLLRKLIELDLRDLDSNSLMHLLILESNKFAGRYECRGLSSELYDAILDILDLPIDVTTRNLMGFEPLQTIQWRATKELREKFLNVLIKMADRGGAHVDAKNVIQWKPTLRKVLENEKRWDLAFKYDNLQCACARVLAKNLVPYVNRVPKRMVDFIRAHNCI